MTIMQRDRIYINGKLNEYEMNLVSSMDFIYSQWFLGWVAMGESWIPDSTISKILPAALIVTKRQSERMKKINVLIKQPTYTCCNIHVFKFNMYLNEMNEKLKKKI